MRSTTCLAIVLFSCCFGDHSAQAERPNLVVILCDDLGYGDLECFGHPHIKTPNLNKLADEGIRLTSCYSAAPVCSPSRVGLLTGRSPNRAGVYDWIPPARKASADQRDLVHMRADEVTLPGLLQSAGYATCMAGKWHCNSKFNSDQQPQPGDAGFDHWFGTQNNAAPSHENPKNFVRNGEPVGLLEGYSCQLVAEEAISWMQSHVQSHQEQPFFLYVAFHEPHEPVESPAELVQKYSPFAESEDEAQYFANVENVDIAVGKLVTGLEAAGQRENTLIYFSSDNGPETLNRYRSANRSWGRATPLRGMKLWTTEAGFRVAGIMNWPSKLQGGVVSKQIVSSLDLLPSFCQLAEVALPSDVTLDGTNFLPLLEGRQIEREKPLLWCYYNAINEQRAAMRFGKWKMLAKLDEGKLNRLQNVYAGNATEVQSAMLTDFELFDVERDIAEQENLVTSAPQAQELVALMKRQFAELVEGSHVWERAPSEVDN